MKLRVVILAVFALITTTAFSACGSSGETTTVTAETEAGDSAKVEELQLEKETAQLEAEKAKTEAKTAARKTRKAAEAKAAVVETPEPEPEPEPEEVPDVVGMRLPEAKSTLSAAGYSTQAENTDTTFGILVPSHYTVCTESEPHGSTVTVLAQKYGC